MGISSDHILSFGEDEDGKLRIDHSILSSLYTVRIFAMIVILCIRSYLYNDSYNPENGPNYVSKKKKKQHFSYSLAVEIKEYKL